MLAEGFDLHRPSSVAEALEIAGRFPGEFRYLAGGTDVLPGLFHGLGATRHLISLQDIAELRAFVPEEGRIGAMVPLGTLAESPELRARFPAVAEAARQAASPNLRNSSTLGGNLLLDTRCTYYNQSAFWREALGYCLKNGGEECRVVQNRERCYAAYCGDLAPSLLVHDARIEVAGPKGRHLRPLKDLYDPQADGRTPFRLGPGEILLSVSLPHEKVRSTYLKLRARSAPDFPEASVAIALTLEGKKLRELRVAASGVATVPLLFEDLTLPLIGHAMTEEVARDLAEKVSRRLHPVTNTAFPPDYRKHVFRHFLMSGIHELQSGTH